MPRVLAAQPSRLVWLVVSLCVGAGVAMAGYSFSGSQYWFLAIPASLAAVWLFVGTPEQCTPSGPEGKGSAEG